VSVPAQVPAGRRPAVRLSTPPPAQIPNDKGSLQIQKSAGLSSGDKTLLKNRKPNAVQGRLLTGANFGFSFFGFFTSFF